MNEQPQRDSIEQLAESYVRELRSGNRPSVEQYARRRPELASQIREFFPVLQAIEGLQDERTFPYPVASEPAKAPQIGGYRILHEIGRGGMGVVYQAEQTALGRHVALKIVPGNISFEATRQQLQEEAQILAQVQHPNIVPVFEIGEHQGQPFFSMQLIEGESLADRLKRGPLSSRAAAEILAPVSQAVAEAHRRGIVHRDLKPSNILLDPAGRPLVADFGLARFFEVGQLTATGVVAGTPSYMSPEQAQDGRVNPTSDIYSLGAVLYEMLTGRPPFQAASPVEVIMMVLEEDPLPPRALNSRVDRDLEAIALKCLHKQEELRYESAESLGADLQAYVDDAPISAAKYRLSDTLMLLRRETRFGPTLETWGAAMMFQAWYLLLVYGLSGVLKLGNFSTHWPYYFLWAGSFPFWFVGFHALRSWQGVATLAERQLSHLWIGGATVCVTSLVLEGTLRLPALILSPIFAIVGFTQSFAMANLLSRIFYLPAIAYAACSLAMIILVRVGQLRDDGRLLAAAMMLLAVVHWVAFFFPGLYYHRRHLQRQRRVPDGS